MRRLLLVFVALAGCTRPIGHVGALATRPVKVPVTPVAEGVEGRSCGRVALLVIPIGRRSPSVELALRDAVGHAPGSNGLTGTSLTSETAGIPGIYRRTCLRVRGDAVRLVRPR